MNALASFGMTVLTMLRDVLPIAGILIGFQLFVLRRPINNPGRVALGLVFVLLGLALFLEGLELALFPLGRLMAEQLTAPAFLYGADGLLLKAIAAGKLILEIDPEHTETQKMLKPNLQLLPQKLINSLRISVSPSPGFQYNLVDYFQLQHILGGKS